MKFFLLKIAELARGYTGTLELYPQSNDHIIILKLLLTIILVIMYRLGKQIKMVAQIFQVLIEFYPQIGCLFRMNNHSLATKESKETVVEYSIQIYQK